MLEKMKGSSHKASAISFISDLSDRIWCEDGQAKLLWYANNWKKIILNDTNSNCIGLFYNIIERFGVIFIFERI